MNGINWLGALTISVVVHVAILSAMVLTSPSPVADDLDLSIAEGEEAGVLPDEAPVANPEVSAKAEAPTKPESPAKVETPVKIEVPAKPEVAVKPSTPVRPTAADAGYMEYTVKSGDNLTVIAKRAGCTFTEIAAANGKSVKELTNLRVGQVIKLPKSETRP